MKKIFILPVIIATLLAGCASNKTDPNKEMILKHQQEQLASVVASGQYLRDVCVKASYPDDASFIARVLVKAKEKGWDTDNLNQQNLESRAKEIYAELVKDKTPSEEKCGYFRLRLSFFLQ